MTSSLRVVDKGMERILRELPYLRGASVDVGVQSDAGTGDDGDTPIAAYAAWNEFGTKSIPARPFMATASDENSRKWTQTAGKVLNSIYEGRTTAEAGLAILGQMAEDDIKNKIISIKQPILSPITIELRRRGGARGGADVGDAAKAVKSAFFVPAAAGEANPLVDTGTMLNSIRYVVNI